MPFAPRLQWPAYSPEATLPKTEFPVCPHDNSLGGFIQRAVFQLDWVLRRWQGIYEFCRADDCLLRAAIAKANRDVELPDGTWIRRGDRVLELHWWNEHVARLVANKPALARAKLFPSLVQHSLQLFGRYLVNAPEARDLGFIHAHAVLVTQSSERDIADRAQQYGFWTLVPSADLLGRAHDFFEEFFVRALFWALHRRKRVKRLRTLKQVELWATRSEFLARYAPAQLVRVVEGGAEELEELAAPAAGRRSRF